MINDELVYDKYMIAQEFNDYFSNIANKIHSDLHTPCYDPVDNILGNFINSIYFTPISCNEILHIVNNLKNSSNGLNSIPTKILNLLVPHLHLL